MGLVRERWESFVARDSDWAGIRLPDRVFADERDCGGIEIERDM